MNGAFSSDHVRDTPGCAAEPSWSRPLRATRKGVARLTGLIGFRIYDPDAPTQSFANAAGSTDEEQDD